MLISDADWAAFKSAIDEFCNDAYNKDIIWRRLRKNIDRFGEGTEMDFDDLPIQVFVSYNFRRYWKNVKASETGKLDENLCIIFLNKQYLADNDFLNEEGYFKFNPEYDKFIIDGASYEPYGENPMSQADTTNLLFQIILVPSKHPEGVNIH